MSAPAPLRDIEDRADCERLVRAFYRRAMDDPMIGYLFVDVAKLDLEAHVPRHRVLLGDDPARRDVLPRRRLPAPRRPARAVPAAGRALRALAALWRATVDETFAGQRAELAKAHAERVAAPSTGACTGCRSRRTPPRRFRSR
jgi:hemoglobin